MTATDPSGQKTTRNIPVLAYITFSEVAAIDFFDKKEGRAYDTLL